MINIFDELQNFNAIDIKALEERNGLLPEEIKNSVLLYNKSIESIKNKSEDIAIIELKKSISLNPHFYEATNLLGLCYYMINETQKAEDMFNKVLSAENNSVRALGYLKNMNLSRDNSVSASKHKTSKQKKQNKSKNLENNIKRESGNFKHLMDFLKHEKINWVKYTIVFTIGGFLVFSLSLSFHGKSTELPTISNINLQDVVSKDLEYEAKYNKLLEDFQKQEKNIQKSNSELEYIKNTSKLAEVEKLFASKNYEQAADLLLLISNVEFKGAEKEKLDKLVSDVFPRATWIVFEDGNNLFNNQKYKEAVDKFLKVQKFGGNFEYLPESMYNLGKSYISLRDKKNAIEVFNKLREKYPNSDFAKYSEFKILELNQN